MRRQRPLTLLAVLALASVPAACGADDELSTQLPKTAPDLTVPTDTTEGRAADTPTTATTATSTTTTGAPAAPPPAAAAAPPPAAPPPAAPGGSATTGGQAPATGQSTTGGAPAGGGEFENFCAQNPGAC
ncbi:MAG TPA: hypothetical protein VG474_14180 [Solirubrobacteraceae bacterium]|nr:hypothetical protein [Solirubrobacteraceae bacterium]